MARNVSFNWGTIPEPAHKVFLESKNLTTTGTYNRLKKQRIKPTTSLSDIKSMARQASKKSKVPIHITTNMAGRPNSDAVCVTESDKKSIHLEVRIHPVVQYYRKRHIKDIIGHELDHVVADQRRYNSSGRKTLK